MAMTEQILPNIEGLACGTVGVRMYYDDSITGMTFPTTVKFLDIGEFKESIDYEAGITEIENVDIVVAEDYSTHSEGFWYKLFSENPDVNIEFLFTIVEGSDETFLFKGNIYRENIKVPEYYLDNLTTTPTDWVRGMEFKLVSSINVLKNVNKNDLFTEILTHVILITDPWAYDFVTFRAVFASAIKLAYGESYDEDLVINNSTDIQVYDEIATAWISPLDTYLPADYFREVSGANGRFWLKTANAYDVIKYICKEFGFVPRYSFGTTAEIIHATPANNKSRLVLEARGRSGASITLPNKFVESEMLMDTPRKSQKMHVYDTFTPENGFYFVDGVGNAGVPPSYIDFDIQLTVDHELHVDGSFSYAFLWTYNGVDTVTQIDHARYWNYDTGAYVEVDQETDYGMAGALAWYLFYRFTQGRYSYTRTYAGLDANNGVSSSQRWLRTLMQTTIHDGITNRTFYATEVSKNLKDNKAQVTWVQV